VGEALFQWRHLMGSGEHCAFFYPTTILGVLRFGTERAIGPTKLGFVVKLKTRVVEKYAIPSNVHFTRSSFTDSPSSHFLNTNT
jgi:hypothetical protein